MTFRPTKKQPDISRLKAVLLDSGLQNKDSALFQVINQLIDWLSSNLIELNSSVTNISGTDVTGPTSSLNNAFVLFDGITGKIIKDGGLTVNLATQVSGDLPFSNIAQIVTASILGRNTAGLGDIEVLSVLPNVVQDNITRLGTVVSGIWNATDIAFTNIVQISTASILGRNTVGTGDIEVLSTLPNTVQDNITRLGTVVSGIWNGTDIAFANIVPSLAASRLLGRGSAAGAGDFQEITLGSRLLMSGTILSVLESTEETTTVIGTQNNYDLDARFTYLRVNNISAVSFTGFSVLGSTPSAGDRVIIDNIGSSTVKVAHQNVGSTITNRIITESTNGQIIGASGRMEGIYDGTTGRWRISVILPGNPIQVAFNSGNFTASGAMTWTVESADQLTFQYIQYGTIIILDVLLVNTSVGGTLGNQLKIAVPDGFAANDDRDLLTLYKDADSVRTLGFGTIGVGETIIGLFKLDLTNWSSATNNTRMSIPALPFGVQ